MPSAFDSGRLQPAWALCPPFAAWSPLPADAAAGASSRVQIASMSTLLRLVIRPPFLYCL